MRKKRGKYGYNKCTTKKTPHNNEQQNNNGTMFTFAVSGFDTEDPPSPLAPRLKYTPTCVF